MEIRAKKTARGGNTFKSVSGEEEEEERDRLSELPDYLIHEIFSFLDDTKQAVQTCVLSKRWKRTWASLPYLKFDKQCHHTGAKFKNFVRKVLSGRDDCNVGKFDFDSTKWVIDKSLSNRIINYAVSRNVQHLHLYLDNRFHPWPLDYHVSNRSLATLDSIKTLKLGGFKIESLCFKTLTLLELLNCSFCNESDFADSFAHCPNLKSLCLGDCKISSSLMVFKISGPQLANLELRDVFWLRKNQAGLRVDIVAPKLKSFTFSVSAGAALAYPVWNLYLFGNPCNMRDAGSAMKLIDMFKGLQNVQYIELSYTTIQLLYLALRLLEQHPSPSPSPFKRLKSLKVSDAWNNMSASITIPNSVKTYLLGNDPYEEITHVKSHLFMQDVEFWKVQT